MWKLRKKICPKKVEPPVAKKDENGDIISEPSQLKKLYKIHIKGGWNTDKSNQSSQIYSS